MVSSNERNYGIDLLKIVSMFMVVTLHILGNGAVFVNTVSLSLNDTIVWFIEILCFPAVNLFALTTGYLCVDKKFKLKNIFNLWFLVLFYNITLTMVCRGFDLIPIIGSMIPVINTSYWYFTAYIIMMLFSPFINNYLFNISKKEYSNLVKIILLVMCFIAFSNSIIGTDVVRVSDGYSAIWLIGLYIVGGYIKLHNFKIKKISKKALILLYIFASLLTLLSRIVILKFFDFQNLLVPNMLIKYNSPTIVISSLAFFLLFIKLRISTIFKKVLSFFSGLSFSVYIIHFHRTLKTVYLNGKFAFFAHMPALQMVFMILFTGVIIYVLCTIIDIFRYYLFKLLRVEKLSEWLDKKIVLMLTKKG